MSASIIFFYLKWSISIDLILTIWPWRKTIWNWSRSLSNRIDENIKSGRTHGYTRTLLKPYVFGGLLHRWSLRSSSTTTNWVFWNQLLINRRLKKKKVDTAVRCRWEFEIVGYIAFLTDSKRSSVEYILKCHDLYYKRNNFLNQFLMYMV